MAAAAAMEHNGAPIDVDMLGQLQEHWTGIQDALIADIDVGCGYHVYDGRTFKADRFRAVSDPGRHTLVGAHRDGAAEP